jgi:UDP-N-acetylmuramate dehydrogenase
MGQAAVSSKHPLALVSRPGGSARDIIALAAHIKRQVEERFGIALSPEPVLTGFGDDPDAAYLRGTEVRLKPDTTVQN